MADRFSGLLWAKTGWHPLLFHMLDAAFVAGEVLRSEGGRAWRQVIASSGGLSQDYVQRVVPFLVGLHDIGKAAPSFQKRAADLAKRLCDRGLSFPDSEVPEFSHAEESYYYLWQVLERFVSRSAGADKDQRRLVEAIAQAVGSHHGVFHGYHSMSPYPFVGPNEDCEDKLQWSKARLELMEELKSALGEVYGEWEEPVAMAPGNLSALTITLNGLTTLCDWIASDQTLFPYAGEMELRRYVPVSRERAERAVASLGIGKLLELPDGAFAELFPDKVPPRPLQASVDCWWPQQPGPWIAILEAPMGEGRTEAALLLACRIGRAEGVRGVYFALPTMATSRQMHGRVAKRIGEWCGDRDKAAVLLINSQARLETQLEQALERSRDADGGDAEHETAAADLSSWFLPAKRSLLWPYGVGTVDQALLGALRVRHVSLRLLGLAGKVVVLDEVHAYDVYMSRIIDRLLEWLRELGTSVVVLSATLPSQRRKELLSAFMGEDMDKWSETREANRPYPLVTIGRPGEPAWSLAPDGVVKPREVALKYRVDGDEQRTANARYLLSRIAKGGCAAWICNTVAEAQECFTELKHQAAEMPAESRPEILLFHARFPEWRRECIETAVLNRFGPPDAPGVRRPERAILVATQVIEQSLDLDFDLIMTQLAPVDLLLQRMGRLHRFPSWDCSRPPGLTAPELVVLGPRGAKSGRGSGDTKAVCMTGSCC